MSNRFDTWQDKVDDIARSPAFLMFIGGIVLLIFSGWLWWGKVYSSPRAVFWGMLENNLSTMAVTGKQVNQNANGLKVTKTSQLYFGAQNLVRIQADTTAIASGTSVKTETIATPAQEFNRYISVKAGAKEGAAVPDLSSVLNKWADGADGSTAFAQTALRPYGLPFANLPADDRDMLMKQLRDNTIFETDYKVQRSVENGRPIYTYDVRIQPVAYIAFIKTYARSLGFKELDSVQPSAAQGSPAIETKISVDARSHRLAKIEYPGQGYSETYGDYNIARKITLPKAQITGQRLQELVAGLR